MDAESEAIVDDLVRDLHGGLILEGGSPNLHLTCRRWSVIDIEGLTLSGGFCKRWT